MTDSFIRNLDNKYFLDFFKQATLSHKLLSRYSNCIIIARHHEWRIVSVLFAILGLVLVMPTTVAAVGILKVFGLNGWVANSLIIYHLKVGLD